MNQSGTLDGFFRWLIPPLFLAFVNLAWSLTFQMEVMRLKGLQHTFSPSPPLLPEWQFYVTDALLIVQLAVSGLAVWRVKKGRGYLITILSGIWLSIFAVAGGYVLGMR